MSAKPVIGYTTRDFSIDPLQWLISLSIRIAGGKPVRLKPSKDRLGDMRVDALIIGGGTDLYPDLFKGKAKEYYKYDRPRDEMETRWLEYAENHNSPVLGICRGAQMINVFHGGSLHLDFSKVYEGAKYHSGILAQIFYRKKMKIEKDTLLHSILGKEEAMVNSMHSQSIDRLGRGLKVSSAEINGVVQGIELPEKDFYLGVQFHPEAMIYKDRYRRIFERLVQAARKHMERAKNL